jgi:hypothetical protein
MADGTRQLPRKPCLSQPEQRIPQKWQRAVREWALEPTAAGSRPTAEFASSRSSCAGGIEP